MQLDVAAYRRVAEKWALKDENINPSAAAVLMLQMCSELERLQKADYEFQAKLADGITDAFLDRRWIPVGERLPPLLTEVLGWHPDDRARAWFRHSGTVQGGPRAGTYWESWSPQDRECDDCEVDAPTHWMPLPEPPGSLF